MSKCTCNPGMVSFMCDVHGEKLAMEDCMGEVLEWASENVWTMMRPDANTDNRWFVLLGNSNYYYASTLYEALYKAWENRDK